MPAATRKQTYHRENLEEQLLTLAAEIIATKGIEGLSLRELGRAAGVSRSAPYHYFADKSTLLFRVGELGFERLSAAIQRQSGGKRGTLKRFRAGLAGYVRFAVEDPHFFGLMFGGLLRRDLQADELAFSSPAARTAFQSLLEGIEALQGHGILPAGDPFRLLNVFWAYTHGVAALARDTHLKKADPSAVLEDGLDALFRAYGRGQELP